MDETVVDLRDFECEDPLDQALQSVLLGSGILDGLELSVLQELAAVRPGSAARDGDSDDTDAPPAAESVGGVAAPMESPASLSTISDMRRSGFSEISEELTARPSTAGSVCDDDPGESTIGGEDESMISPPVSPSAASATFRDMRQTGTLGELGEEVQSTLLGATLYMYDPDAARPSRSSRPRRAVPGEAMTTTASSFFQTVRAHDRNAVRRDSVRGLDSLRNAVERFLLESAGNDAVGEDTLVPLDDTRMSMQSRESTIRPGPNRGERTIRMLEGSLSPVGEGEASMWSETQDFDGNVDGSILNATAYSLNDSAVPNETSTLSMPREQPSEQSIIAGSFTMHARTMLRRLAAVDAAFLDDSLARSLRRVLEMGTALTVGRLSEAEIRALPKISLDAEDQQCSICLETFQPGALVTELPCAHFFHVDCIADWFRRSEQCPLCRAFVTPAPDGD